MKIFIGSDHRGIEVKELLKKYLLNKNYEVEESSIENSKLDSYPDFAFDVCKKVLDNNAIGILICGNGIGMSIASNKVKGIRCARCVDKDDAFNAKSHNGCNVIALGANLDINNIYEIVDTFIESSYPSEERHISRVNKIINYENGEYNEL